MVMCEDEWATRIQLASLDDNPARALAAIRAGALAVTRLGHSAGGERCCGTLEYWHHPWCDLGPTLIRQP